MNPRKGRVPQQKQGVSFGVPHSDSKGRVRKYTDSNSNRFPLNMNDDEKLLNDLKRELSKRIA